MSYVKHAFKTEKQFRLPGYDYSQNGFYFVTICTQKRSKIFTNSDVGTDPGFNPHVGMDPRVRSDKNHNQTSFCLNDIGLMIQKWWSKIPMKFLSTKLDEFCIMPNHLHGIIIINKAQTLGSAPTMGQIIQWFKTMTTNEYMRNISSYNWPKFTKRIWQSRFYDHIIRNEKEYFAIKQYIKDNPKNWLKDEENLSDYE